MAAPPLHIQPITLVLWEDRMPEASLRAAFRRKDAWVVNSAHRSSVVSSATVLGNLAGSYVKPEGSGVDSVRSALGKGLDRDAFNRLKIVTDLSTEELSRIIRIPQRTLARRTRFKPEESERILRVASVFQRTLEVLGNIESARRWFTSPKVALAGNTPVQFCDTEPGAREVEQLLGRIEHGVFT